MTADLGIAQSTLFAAFSIGMAASGLVSPTVGRIIDRNGGRAPMSIGSIIAALAFALLASAQHPAQVFIGWIVGGVAMSFCLYDAAFATLARAVPQRHRRAVTALTLIGALASTVFWPLTQWLLDLYGWRITLAAHAALNLLVCMPLHWMLIPRYQTRASINAYSSSVARPLTQRPAGFVALATAFAFGQFITSAVAVHIIAVLSAGGLTAQQAVWIGALIGPMQLMGRLVEMFVAARVASRAVARTTFLLMIAAVLALALVGSSFLLAVVFVVLYGWANGTLTIVRGTLPAELYGRDRYGELLGLIARPAFAARAVAPFAVAAALSEMGRGVAVATLIAAALIAYVAFEWAAKAVDAAA